MNTKRFLTAFFISFLIGSGIVFGFVTWVDPLRNLNYPWTLDFVSDRNIAYRRLTLMREHPGFTDLVVGSSTSEVFMPSLIQQKIPKVFFLASNGGASAALRYLFVKDALEKNKKLERIIYIADLFEFKDLFLYNEVYYQPDLRQILDADAHDLIEKPKMLGRLEDYISRKIIDRSFRVLNEYKKFKKGQFKSEFHQDGSTTTSMIFSDSKEPFESRVKRTSTEHDFLYKDMNSLHEPSKKMLLHMVNLVKKYPQVELDIVIAPVHPDYFKHFEPKFIGKKLYTDWTAFIKGLGGDNVKIYDYSYPVYLEKGITGEEKYWNDGVHFNGNTMQVIIEDIYRQ